MLSKKGFDAASWSAELLDDLRPYRTGAESGEPLPESDLPWRDWVRKFFPQVCAQPFAERHVRLWEWFDSLAAGEPKRARVEVWGRGGAKSSTAELGCSRAGAKLSRRFVLYVSETQDQADKHVQAVATLFETLGVERMVGKYGNSKGWRRDQLRTAHGFNVAALGLDVAARGIKLDHFRPDLIIFDDIDSQHDSPATVAKKISSITKSILPAGSRDCAVLFVQNLIHEDGVVGQLVDGRADFLLDREPAAVEPAVHGLKTEKVQRADGLFEYKIVAGEATWEGQNLAICEQQINKWGLDAFLKEAQHEVRNGAGWVFDTAQFRVVKPADVPPLAAVCLAWDLAATEGAGDWTVGVLMGKALNGVYYILAVLRGQWASHRVNGAIRLSVNHYRERTRYPYLILHFPQDPGQAGKAQAVQLQAAFPGARAEPVTGSKATRAAGFAEAVNLGNVCLVQQDLPDFLLVSRAETGGLPLAKSVAWGDWHRDFKDVLRKFKDITSAQVDDDVDAGADAFNALRNDPGETKQETTPGIAARLSW